MRLVRLKPRREAFGWRNKEERSEGTLLEKVDALPRDMLAVSETRNDRLKARRAEGLTYKALGEEFGISAARAYAICNR